MKNIPFTVFSSFDRHSNIGSFLMFTFALLEPEMPSGSVFSVNYNQENGGSVAVVAFANALLDMSISVKDDSLVSK